MAAKETTRLILVDGVVSDRIQSKSLARLTRSFFLRFFERAFVVALSDKEFFCRELGMDSSRVDVTGDTKYDRVRERALISDAQAAQLRDKIDRIFGPSKRLIVGSGWHKDIDLVLAVCRTLIQGGLFGGWQLVIAPHLVNEVMISWIIEKCSELNLSYCLYSQLDNFKEDGQSRSIIILDKMGTLAEFYACGQAAFVGGGLHHQVHNVLEPAIRGLYLAFGPRYQNSAEARLLVDEGLAQVIDGETQLYNWWRNLIETRVSVHNALLTRVRALCGSADAIIQLLKLTDI
jgi:3-deoxy-D-manno-octulosonic-acid transferase